MAGDDRFDEELLTSVLSEFAHTLANRFEVSDVLYRLVEHVIEILRVDGAGVSVVDEDGMLRPVTVPNELTWRLESVEEGHQQGPCIDAFRDGEVVVVNQLDDQAHQWPDWCRAASEMGVHAVLGVPLRVHQRSLGAMNIYNLDAREWRNGEIRVARVLCDMAASYVANASALNQAQRTNEQLQEALESRVIIEQAKGILAAEQRITIDQAFVVLRRHSRNHGVSIRSVAHAVVTLGLRPGR